ncbi:PIR Superfamily Protein [Plasmodium ovale wallikeri]|uniref:PIR Superfamily Protein n=1 Tax=Plasmodium ovale wallikeri TaxID=864142 RepID=A0A1A9ARV7_PLAOA|nr:PIR Superfamily Protein [Plasmodium ovale wallikeri]
MEDFPNFDQDHRLINLNNDYPTLEDIDLYKYYKIFSEERDIQNDKTYCQSKIQFQNEFSGGQIYELCAKLRRNFRIISTDINYKLSEEDACRYLKLWLNDEIIHYRFDKDAILSIKDNWDNIKNEGNYYHAKCDDAFLDNSYDNFISSNKDAFQVIEIICEYLKLTNGDIQIHNMAELNSVRNSLRNEYISDNFSKYKTISEECSRENTTHLLCNIYNKYKIKYRERFNELEKKVDQEIIAVEKQILNAEVAERSFLSRLQEIGRILGIDELMTPASTTSIAVIGSFVGIFLLLLLFYKFTPFGSFIISRIRKMKRMGNKEDEEPDELFLYTCENESINMDRNPYRISHHSGGYF